MSPCKAWEEGMVLRGFGQLWLEAVTGDGDFPTEAAAACGTALEKGDGQAEPGMCAWITAVRS